MINFILILYTDALTLRKITLQDKKMSQPISVSLPIPPANIETNANQNANEHANTTLNNIDIITKMQQNTL